MLTTTTSERVSADGKVEYRPISVTTLLCESAPGSARHWLMDPYEGCEVGCAFCPARLELRSGAQSWADFQRRVGVKVNAVEVLMRELRAGSHEGSPIVVGTRSDPWQPAEEQFRLTRALLGAIGEEKGLELRFLTRSSLVARDTDVLVKLARENRVSVAFSLASMDDHVNRLIEPRAPSAMRRFAAMEALARAGLEVGVLVSPLLPGLDAKELGLAALLTRAANAGAHFAGLGFVELAPAVRESLLGHLASISPAASTRLRRVLGRRPLDPEERGEQMDAFRGLCGRLGLVAVEDAAAPRSPARTSPPTQMALFS